MCVCDLLFEIEEGVWFTRRAGATKTYIQIPVFSLRTARL